MDKAIIYMHGVGGGTHGPSSIYHQLAETLVNDGISSLLINYRHPDNLEECISDVLSCIRYLDDNYHMNCIGLIGWSFGGSVVISAAEMDKRVKTVVTIASQTYGTQDVDKIPGSLLLLHGKADKTLPYGCSVDIASRAHEPKKLILFRDGDHGISQHKDEMFNVINGWMTDHLNCQ